MVGCLVRGLAGVAVLALAGYCAVAVPIGRRTLSEHVAQIAATRPARELREDLAESAERTVHAMSRWLRDRKGR